MKKRGLFWIGLGLILWAVSVVVGQGQSYQWDIMIWLAGWASILAGFVRNENA